MLNLTNLSYYRDMFANAYTDDYPWGYRAWVKHVEADMTVGQALDKILRSPIAHKYYPNLTPDRRKALLNFFVALYTVDRAGIPEALLKDWSLEDYVTDNLTIGEILKNDEVVQNIVNKAQREGYSDYEILTIKRKLLGETVPLEEFIPREIMETLEEMQEARMDIEAGKGEVPVTATDILIDSLTEEIQLPIGAGKIQATFEPPPLSNALNFLEKVEANVKAIGSRVSETSNILTLMERGLYELNRGLKKYTLKIGEGEILEADYLREQLQALVDELKKVTAIVYDAKNRFMETFEKWSARGIGKSLLGRMERIINVSDETIATIHEILSDIVNKYRQVLAEAVEQEAIEEKKEEIEANLAEWWEGVRMSLIETLSTMTEAKPADIIERLKRTLEENLPELYDIIGATEKDEKVEVNPVHLGVIMETFEKLEETVKTLETEARQAIERKNQLEKEVEELRNLIQQYKTELTLLEEQLAERPREEERPTVEISEIREEIREELSKLREEITREVSMRETDVFSRLLDELERLRREVEEVKRKPTVPAEEVEELVKRREALSHILWAIDNINPDIGLLLLEKYEEMGYVFNPDETDMVLTHAREVAEELKMLEGENVNNVDMGEIIDDLAKELGYKTPSVLRKTHVYATPRFVEGLLRRGVPKSELEASCVALYLPIGTLLDYEEKDTWRRTVIMFPDGDSLTYSRVPISALLSIKTGGVPITANLHALAQQRLDVLNMVLSRDEFDRLIRMCKISF